MGQECHCSTRLQRQQQCNGVQQGLAALAAVVLCRPAREVRLQICQAVRVAACSSRTSVCGGSASVRHPFDWLLTG